MNCIWYRAVSVQIKMAPLLLTAMLIWLPAVSRCDPAVLVAVGVHVFVVSWWDHLTNMLSCVDVSAMVVSVPRQITCLSSPEISINRDFVGPADTLVVAAALLESPAEVSQ